MRHASTSPPSLRVLVSDFDGTMTRRDFYRLALEALLPPDVPDHWSAYRSGAITHFEALRRFFAAIRAGEDELLAVAAQMELDPRLAESVASLDRAGWRVVVASAGCDWYIRRLLDEAGVDLEVHANPGLLEEGRGLLMERPEAGAPFRSEALGVDKAAVVRRHLEDPAVRSVAFAGDGFPDLEAARLVPDALRFARGDLAGALRDEGLPFHDFEAWSDIATALATRSG